jgi:hypothetical protein
VNERSSAETRLSENARGSEAKRAELTTCFSRFADNSSEVVITFFRAGLPPLVSASLGLRLLPCNC